jgi:hypothetical protein
MLALKRSASHPNQASRLAVMHLPLIRVLAGFVGRAVREKGKCGRTANAQWGGYTGEFPDPYTCSIRPLLRGTTSSSRTFRREADVV